MGQNAKCHCRNCGVLLASDRCRFTCSTSQRFRTKFLSHADPNGFADTRFRADTQPDSYRDSEGSDQNHSQPNADSNSHTDPDTNAARLSRSECQTNSHANISACGCISLGAFRSARQCWSAIALKHSGFCALSQDKLPQKQNPPVLLAGFLLVG
jgi:hypothetical protein